MSGSAYAAEVMADDPIHYWPLQTLDMTDRIGTADMAAVGSVAKMADAATGREKNGILDPNSLGGVYLDIANTPFTVVTGPVPLGEPSAIMAGPDSPEPPYARVNAPAPSAAPLALEFWFRRGSYGVPGDTAAGPSVTVQYGTTSFLKINGLGTWFTDVESVDGTNGTTGAYIAGYNVEFSNSSLSKKLVSTPTGVNAGIVGEWQHIAVVASTSTVKLYVNGVERFSTSTAAGTTTATTANATAVTLYVSNTDATDSDAISHLAVYSTAPAAARWLAHYEAGLHAYGHPIGDRSGTRIGRVLDDVGWPSGQRDLSTGDSVHGPWFPAKGSALGYLREIEVAEQGYVYITNDGKVAFRGRNWIWAKSSEATFSDDGAGLSYENVEIDANSVDNVRNVITVTNMDSEVTVRDATSVTNYGTQDDSIGSRTVIGTQNARNLADYRLRSMKDPASRITSLVVHPRLAPTTMVPAVLGLELGDVITVERTPQGVGSQIVKTVVVQGVAHSVTRGVWDVQLYLSPAPLSRTAAPYLIMGDSTYGKIGATAGNKVPY